MPTPEEVADVQKLLRESHERSAGVRGMIVLEFRDDGKTGLGFTDNLAPIARSFAELVQALESHDAEDEPSVGDEVTR